MKKIYLVLSILFLFFFIIGIACYFTLPKTVGYFAGKIINGTVNIEDIKISYNKAFIVHIKGIEARGDLKGFIRSVYISFTLKRKLFFDEITISDFDLDVKLAKQKRPQFIKIPSEHISLENGKVKYEGQTFRILKAKLDYVKSKKLFVFSLNIENDRFFKSIKTEGTGTYSKREFEIKGKADIAGINLGQISNDLKGTTQVSCNFFYNKNGLKLEGPFDIVDFYLKLNFFTKPLLLKNVSGKLSLAYSKDMAVVKIRDVNFKSTPFELSLKLDSKGLHTLTINSNYVDVEDVKEYISFNYFSKDVGKYVGFIKGGKVKTNRLEYISRNDRFACNLSIKDTSLTYDDFEFTQIKADIVFDNNKANIKNLEARYKNSVIKDFAGDINYKKGYYARIKGSYFINLTDIPAKFNLDNIRFKNGTSEGEIEFEYKGPKEYIISGRGVLNKSEVSYNNISMIAFGDYRFTNDEIEFDPIVLTKGNTDLRLKGRWRKNLLNIKISGMLDVNTVKQFVKIPFDIKGLMDIDVDVRQQENTLQLLCNANLDHLSYKIEGYLKKEKGIKNSFALQALKRDEFIEIRDFNFKLEDLNLIFSGILSKKGAKT